MRNIIMSSLLLLLLSACSTHAGKPSSADAEPARQPTTEAQCLQLGGAWKQLGRAPVKQCLLQTTDAGKACSDSKQCQGLCMAPQGSADGTTVGGTCSVDTNRFGCRQQLRDGVPFTMCID